MVQIGEPTREVIVVPRRRMPPAPMEPAPRKEPTPVEPKRRRKREKAPA